MFLDSFSDELVKVAAAPQQARYLRSQALSSRLAAGAGAGKWAQTGGFAAPQIAAAIGLGALTMHIRRVLGARAIHGQIRRGGKGLMEHDKKRLAEAAGMSVPKLEKAMGRIGRKAAKNDLSTYPISRAINTKYNPINIPKRYIGSRGFAGRAHGGTGLTEREIEILKVLKHENDLLRQRQWLLGAGAGAGVAGLGAAGALKD